MKKALLSILIIIVLAWSYGTVFAQGRGKSKAKSGQAKQPKNIEKKEKTRRAEADKPSSQGKEKQARRQKQEREQRKEREQEKEREQKKERETKGKGNEHQQQLKALEAQMVHEEAKHQERVARLNRIRELASEEGNTKTVERVDKLLGKEQTRYNRKLQQMEKRRQKILQLAEKNLYKEKETEE